eukprot:TRINITY_DN3830_c0_g1_i1.p2 TRINITY_DN3830_c0_g1~~TRINITY_DN3830_c0_g1_i1.p2  ORF type:complete len:139 (-),score=46.14 TRINITY_DN3830_c0_g1_i1:256-672(-)
MCIRDRVSTQSTWGKINKLFENILYKLKKKDKIKKNMEPNSLKTGTTQTLQLDPSKQSQLKPTATVLKNRIGGGQTKLGGTKQLFQKSKQQQSATSDKDNQIVREGSDIVTPKILISAKLTQIAQEYLKLEQEEEKKS